MSETKPEPEPINLFLCTPCYGGLCLETYAGSVLGLQREMLDRGWNMFIDTTENESLIQRARNVSVGRFLKKTECTHFMFIDADIHFDPMAVINLIEAKKDLTVAVYPKKTVMWDHAAEAVKNEDERPLEMLSSSLVANFDRNDTKITDGFVPLLDGPTGFMLFTRDMLEKMYSHYEEDLKVVNDHANRDFDDYVAVFDCMIDPKSKRYLSEDYAFCRRWQQMGGKLYADVRTTLGHVGNLTFGGSLKERIESK